MGENNFRVCEEGSITGFSSLRGGGGGKNASIYALSGHERIEKRSEE